VFESAEGASQSKNPLNLPYSESESENEQAEEAEQPVAEEQGQDLLLSDIPQKSPPPLKHLR
jgi:hypothetical protein